MNNPSAGHERERVEPDELHNPMPKWFSVCAVVLLGWGAMYFYWQIGELPNAGDHRTAIQVDVNAVVDGASVYNANCASCHQANGQGIASAFPPLDGSRWVIADKAIPVQILLWGVSGPMEVKGQTYNGVMPAMSHLNNAEIAAVLTYIRSNWSNAADAVTAAEIASERTQFTERGKPWVGGKEIIELIGPLPGSG